MIFAAQLISDGIAQRVIRRLVVGVDHRLQLKIHLLQLVPGCMILHNDKFITAEPRQKAVLGQNAGQIGGEGLDKDVAFFVAVRVLIIFKLFISNIITPTSSVSSAF